jgi:hypothetical protein
METNNKNINHLFYYPYVNLLGNLVERTDVVFISSDDITSKQIKSSVKKLDCSLGYVGCLMNVRELRYDRVITDKELKTIVENQKLAPSPPMFEKDIFIYDFAKSQKYVQGKQNNTWDWVVEKDEILKLGKEQNETD